MEIPRQAIAASILLVAITGTVFYVLRDYGPENAIRRFHAAVQSGDSAALARVTNEPIDSPYVQSLASKVAQIERNGANYRILRMEREPGQVAAEVEYQFPNGARGQTLWIVVLDHKIWKVMASETGQVFRRSLGLDRAP